MACVKTSAASTDNLLSRSTTTACLSAVELLGGSERDANELGDHAERLISFLSANEVWIASKDSGAVTCVKQNSRGKASGREHREYTVCYLEAYYWHQLTWHIL